MPSCSWLADQVDSRDVDVFTGFPGQEVLTEGDRVVGVRTGDRGLGRDGEHKPSFEPGVDIRAKVTIFCDGVRGNLTKDLVRRFELGRGRQPEQFAVGLKELWEVPRDRLAPGSVIHSMGYPLRHEEFGGGFIYGLPDGQVSIGFVVGLDYKDPLFDPHMAFNRFKQHPLVSTLLAGGQLVRYGAKALPEGGWNTIPQPYTNGALIAGDAGGFLNSMRLKGIHLAMRTGMLAAESAFEAIQANDTSAQGLSPLPEEDRPQSCEGRALPGSQRAPGVRPRLACRPCVRRLLVADEGLVAERGPRPRRTPANADAA